jgi:hypothetical protein
VLRFYWGYPESTCVKDFAGLSVTDIPSGSYVLINRERLDFLVSWYGYSVPAFYRAIPSDWRAVLADAKGTLYLTSAASAN